MTVGLPQTIPHLWLHTRRAARGVTTGLIGGTRSKVIFPDQPNLDQRGRFSHKHCYRMNIDGTAR